VPGDENEGQRRTALGQVAVAVPARSVPALDIEQQAVGARGPLAGQKLSGGCKCLDGGRRGAEPIAQTLAR
jgi:hypothetical protein